jgi:thiol-disulfide isomerase/thioredoxin
MKIQVIEQDNCGWCTRLHPHINKLAQDLSMDIEYVNITGDYELAQSWMIKTTPTVCLMDDHMEGEQARFIIDQDGIPGIIKGIREYVNE